MNRPLRLVLVGALAPAAALAQPMASEHAVTAQTLDGTTITVEYYRPSARGRALFGALVPWDRPWTPGANWATTIDVDRDVRIDGRPLPKGRYTIWAIPRADEWTLLFDRRPRVFHTQGPNAAEEQLRVTARPTTGPHAELLTWSFPAAARDTATLQLQWGTTVVPLRIVVARVGSDTASGVRRPE